MRLLRERRGAGDHPLIVWLTRKNSKTVGDFKSAIDEVYDALGVPATYTDRDGATQCVTAIVEYDLQQFGTVADISGKTAVISVRVSEMAEKPRRGETYTVKEDGCTETVYTVDSTPYADELEHRALVA